ncbi:CYTH domain-containing protein [Pseudomonas aeruginosa]|uniref:CYTH domain-containing protein n=1 Tax=Pseudomonas aeruginosa TaxID=287 RepID=UPI0009A4ED5E|nr:CYTH domain-containing protein [Pseudomonas aeruginosa]
MQKETEIKLRVSRATLEALQEHPLLKKRNKSGWERRELYNQYYDTPGRELARAKVALRMRRDGEQYIQTLKSRGQSVAGLSERNEWDWYLEKNKLDLKKLDDKCWPAALKDLDKKQLKPIFSTDFVRQRAEIAWGRGKARVVVEAALDLGKVVAGDNQEEICELELELRQGDAAALLELAAELAADLPLMPCDISKAERGYRLFDPNSYEVDPPAQKLLAETPLDGAFAAIAASSLAAVERKRRALAVLRLLGFPTAALVGFVMLLALFSAVFGLFLAGLLYAATAGALNHLFDNQSGEFVCRLLPSHYLTALLATLLCSVLAAASGGWRAARIEAAEGLRDV